jgi:DNA topoisomerase-2
VCKGDLIVSNRKRSELLAELVERGYDLCPNNEKKETEEENDDSASIEESTSDAELAKGYEYLLGMKIWSLTFERAEELRRQKMEKTNEVKQLNATSPEAIWLSDLDTIDEALNERDLDISAELKREVQAQNKNKVHNAKKASAAKKKAAKGKKKNDDVSNVYIPCDPARQYAGYNSPT